MNRPAGSIGRRLVDPLADSLSIARARLIVAALVVATGFGAVTARLINLSLYGASPPRLVQHTPTPATAMGRGDILDRNGIVLATNLATASLYAEAHRIADPDAAAAALAGVLGDLDAAAVRARLTSDRQFVWLRRHLTPRQQFAINRLGVPGLGFAATERRIYPQGPLAAHVLGGTDIDSIGIAGIEKAVDDELAGAGGDPPRAVQLALDVRVQHALADELRLAVARFRAKGAAGVILDADNGEILALASVPDFDPNEPNTSPAGARFNRATLGVYELGSVFKTFTVAQALDDGVAGLRDGYDARHPIQVSRFRIRDDHPKRRWLSLPEIFIYSSNIGAAKMALDIGGPAQRRFFEALGLHRPAAVRLPERGRPLWPRRWREINTMTAAYGHGLAVSPLHLAAAAAAMVNGGLMIQPSLLKRRPHEEWVATRVISRRTSQTMRRLWRLAVEEGTGRKANVPGYLVGGKTGTAEIAGRAGYRHRALLSSFVAAFPMTAPRYVAYVLIEEPQGDTASHGYASAGWTAAPTMARVVSRVAPILQVLPVDEAAREIREAMAVEVVTKGPRLASY